jgi:hypothetical protein
MKEYYFPALSGNVDANGKPIIFRTIVINGYGSAPVRVITGAIDRFCTNGIITGNYNHELRRHTSSKNIDVKHFMSIVRASIENFGGLIRQFNEWQEVKVNEETFQDFLHKLEVSPRLTECLVDRFKMEDGPTRGWNLWGAYSTLTYYATHIDEDAGFGKRDTGYDNDAATLLSREEKMVRWMSSKIAGEVFGKKLETV